MDMKHFCCSRCRGTRLRSTAAQSQPGTPHTFRFHGRYAPNRRLAAAATYNFGLVRDAPRPVLYARKTRLCPVSIDLVDSAIDTLD